MSKAKFIFALAPVGAAFKAGEAVKVSATEEGILIEGVGLPRKSALLPYQKMVEYQARESIRRERVGRSVFWRSFFGSLALGHFGAALGWASAQRPGSTRFVEEDRVVVHYLSCGVTTCFALTSVGDASELALEEDILRNAPEGLVVTGTLSEVQAARRAKAAHVSTGRPARHVEL